ncbi:MAG TPA: hypothetical protein VGH04_02905 [Gemmatimonadaceae bacterium]
MQHTRTRYGIASLVALAGLATACSDSIGAKTSASQLAFTTGPALGAHADAAPITIGGHTLDLSAVTITVSRAELKPAASAVCAGDTDSADNDRSPSSGASADGDNHNGDGQDGCGEMKIGPTTIDLPLDGSVVAVPADAIPAGTFQELELRLAFIRLQGTFDGKAFDVTLSTPVRGDIQFTTPVAVTAGTATSITVTVPVATWFTNADGSLLDPSKLNSTPSLMSQFVGRIATSFHAFEDEDHDGRDDHGGHG